jgi:hypothetical protein
VYELIPDINILDFGMMDCHVRIFERKKVTLDQEIGSGCFGKVYKGKNKISIKYEYELISQLEKIMAIHFNFRDNRWQQTSGSSNQSILLQMGNRLDKEECLR